MNGPAASEKAAGDSGLASGDAAAPLASLHCESDRLLEVKFFWKVGLNIMDRRWRTWGEGENIGIRLLGS